jgi:signal peptidase I
VLEVLIIAVVLYITIWTALQTVRVDGESMVGTLQNNDLLLASKISYYFGDPQRGDIVVLIPPSDPTKDFIKRVIGLPGDTIEIDGNQSPTAVLIKPQGKGPWQRLQEPYLPEKWDTMNFCCLANGVQSSTPQPLDIPAGKYFVMGDNRNKSSDSRSFGLVARDKILAKAFVRVLPFGHFSFGAGPTLIPATAAILEMPAAPAIVLAVPPALLAPPPSASRRHRDTVSRRSVLGDDPARAAALPVEQLVRGEEDRHLAGRALRGVAPMDDVHGEADRQVAADRAGRGADGVGGTEHCAHHPHRSGPLPHHRHHRR